MFENSRKSGQSDGHAGWQIVRRKIERNVDEKNEKKLERNKDVKKKKEEEKKQFRAANERAGGISG